MLRAPCGLVIVEHDGTVRVAFVAPVYPYVAVSSNPADVTDNLKRRDGSDAGAIGTVSGRNESTYLEILSHDCAIMIRYW